MLKRFGKDLDRSLRGHLAGFSSAHAVRYRERVSLVVCEEGIFVKRSTFIETAIAQGARLDCEFLLWTTHLSLAICMRCKVGTEISNGKGINLNLAIRAIAKLTLLPPG